jgi:hypothetical protein
MLILDIQGDEIPLSNIAGFTVCQRTHYEKDREVWVIHVSPKDRPHWGTFLKEFFWTEEEAVARVEKLKQLQFFSG